jgi:hypothetical protein
LTGKTSPRPNWRHVRILDALSGLELGIDLGCGCGWEGSALAHTNKDTSKDGEDEGGDRHSPAAAAGSNEAERLSVEAGPRRSLPKGLLLRLVSLSRPEGERDRLSNREALRGSGSV